MSDKTVLPELPPDDAHGVNERGLYTADQMHEYALAVLAASEDRRDAERYRWLKENQAYVAVHPHYKDLPLHQRTGWTIRLVNGDSNSFDAAIDAAIAAAGNHKVEG